MVTILWDLTPVGMCLGLIPDRVSVLSLMVSIGSALEGWKDILHTGTAGRDPMLMDSVLKGETR